MLLRESGTGVLAIGQASHAWLSGQLARAWGNDRFGYLDPYEEVCLASEQHDVGMARWDLAPTLNPSTGWPHSFIEMPLETHLELWSAGPRRLLSQSRYAALLVSMHGWRLYKRRDLDKLELDQTTAVRGFLEQQRAFQEWLLSSLREDPSTAGTATEQLIARNSQLIWIWDYISLALCLDWLSSTARDVPTIGAPVDIQLTHSRTAYQLEPWPFTADAVTVWCEGRRLSDKFESEAALHDGFDRAPWEKIAFDLHGLP
jgi:hypothetical protein